jgi:hypothetical protein
MADPRLFEGKRLKVGPCIISDGGDNTQSRNERLAVQGETFTAPLFAVI